MVFALNGKYLYIVAFEICVNINSKILEYKEVTTSKENR